MIAEAVELGPPHHNQSTALARLVALGRGWVSTSRRPDVLICETGQTLETAETGDWTAETGQRRLDRPDRPATYPRPSRRPRGSAFPGEGEGGVGLSLGPSSAHPSPSSSALAHLSSFSLAPAPPRSAATPKSACANGRPLSPLSSSQASRSSMLSIYTLGRLSP